MGHHNRSVESGGFGGGLWGLGGLLSLCGGGGGSDHHGGHDHTGEDGRDTWNGRVLLLVLLFDDFPTSVS